MLPPKTVSQTAGFYLLPHVTVRVAGIEPALRVPKTRVQPMTLHSETLRALCWNRTNLSGSSGPRFHQSSLESIQHFVTRTGIAPVNVGLKDRLPHLQNTGRSVPCGTRTRVSTLRGLRPWPSRRMEQCTPNAGGADVGLELDERIALSCKLYESLMVLDTIQQNSADPLGIEPS